jgi:sulfate-transporting ATPase
VQLPTGPLQEILGTGETVQRWLIGLSGVLLLLTLIKFPDGFVALIGKGRTQLSIRPAAHRFNGALRRMVGRSEIGPDGRSELTKSGSASMVAIHRRAAAEERSRVRPQELVVNQLVVKYGAVVAVNGLSLSIKPGEVTGLIGANGAGKSSAIDAITGFARVEAGSVTLGGSDITGLSPVKTARAGLVRCFQSVELFDDLTIAENLAVARERISAVGWMSAPFRRKRGHSEDPVIRSIAEDLGLGDVLERQPGEISHGHRRLVGVARALATDPSVLLLDEPAAGLDERETAELGTEIVRVAREWGVAVLLVEHDVGLVTRISDQMVALDFGVPIASGLPGEVIESPSVRAAYLGVDSHVPQGERTVS